MSPLAAQPGANTASGPIRDSRAWGVSWPTNGLNTRLVHMRYAPPAASGTARKPETPVVTTLPVAGNPGAIAPPPVTRCARRLPPSCHTTSAPPPPSGTAIGRPAAPLWVSGTPFTGQPGAIDPSPSTRTAYTSLSAGPRRRSCHATIIPPLPSDAAVGPSCTPVAVQRGFPFGAHAAWASPGIANVTAASTITTRGRVTDHLAGGEER